MIARVRYAGATPIFAMVVAPCSPDAQRTNSLAAAACLAFLFTANAVGEPNVVIGPVAATCGSGAMLQSRPAALFCSSRPMYQVPIGSSGDLPVENHPLYVTFFGFL